MLEPNGNPISAENVRPQQASSFFRRVLRGVEADRAIIAAVLLFLTGILGSVMVPKLLASRIAHDSPIMLYIAFLIDRFHRVPYRDIFDMNMPGSYALYGILGRLSGYRDVNLRMIELLLLAAVSAAAWLILRGAGRLPAWTGSILFPFLYLSGGNSLSLQREFFIVLFVGIALALLSRTDAAGARVRRRHILIGLLLGLCAVVKPQVILLAPIFVWSAVRRLPDNADAAERRRGVRRLILAFALGLSAPLVVAFAYLSVTHSLQAFLSLCRNYWPLYGAMNGDHVVLSDTARRRSLAVNEMDICLQYLLPCAAGLLLGGVTGAELRDKNSSFGLLILTAIFFALYPAFSGQFWPYHSLPVLYCSVLLFSFSGRKLPRETAFRPLLAAIRVLCFLTLAWHLVFLSHFPVETHPKGGRVDRIAAYLGAHLRPGDTVQPLDWTGGAVHAMLISRAPIATPFIYDFYFYHHVSHPYIQGLRKRFIADLSAAKPRFLIQITTENKPWPSGPDTTRKFPELQQLMDHRYHIVQTGNGYRIWEQNSP